MKVSHVEGSASYGGLGSCVKTRKGLGEGLTGGRAGRVLSREIHAPRRELRVVRGAEALEIGRGPHRSCRSGEAGMGPTRSETLRTRASTLVGNREIPHPSAMRWEASAAERIEKPQGVPR